MFAEISQWAPIIRSVTTLVIAVIAALVIHFIIFHVVVRFTSKSGKPVIDSIKRHCYKPARWLLVFIALRLVLPLLITTVMPEQLAGFLEHLTGIAIIIFICWLIIGFVFVLEDYVLSRFDIQKSDNLRARKVYTQLRVATRIIIAVVIIIGIASVLMTFPRVQQLGTTILASAGVVGIVVGLAAQKTIGTFIAGLQIAITQPIRIDDVVIVEGEWGRIEEITLTYVVVKIWDQRRLVLPITYFIEKPFQNWTRTTSDLLGTVYLYLDYKIPVDVIRDELKKILEESEKWDKRVCVVQVTDTSEKCIQVRALVSAADASAAWGLRCEVREKLIDFIAKNYPDSLPRVRASLDKPEKENLS